MKSMTGFGKREMLSQGTMVGVEIRSVNHRFCEIMVRLPKTLSSMELNLKELIKHVCERGRVEIMVTINGGGTATKKAVRLDRELARRYIHELKSLQQDCQLSGTIDVNVVAGFRDLFSINEEVAPLTDMSVVVAGLTKKALSDLEKMRKKEGAVLQNDLTQRLQAIEGRLRTVQHRIPIALEASAVRLKGRVAKLLEGQSVSMDRLAQEMAMLAERSDVTEELTRLRSHLAQFRAALKEKGAVGKRLDFLLQEMGREVNTIGSKANDGEIATEVVELKSELEKIREQVQNIE
ncbi:MAG: YicC/YloC family endoribonuclease [Nitrospirales bacterium]